MMPDIELINIENFQTQLILIDQSKYCYGTVTCSDFPEIKQSFELQYVKHNDQ